METLKTNDQRKINFDAVIQNEHEVARYFLALLDLVRDTIFKKKESDIIDVIEKLRNQQFLMKFIVRRPRNKM